MLDRNAPIGVMDGGVGGFTVVKELQKLLPHENIVYLGDGKNNPYGNRSAEDIVCLTKQCLHFLREKEVKAVAVACNTISVMIDSYQPDFDFRIFSVVQAGGEDVLSAGVREVGVLSTVFTAETGSYAKQIHAINPAIQVYAQGCPKLARLIENGNFDQEAIDEELRRTLGILLEEHPQLQALVLGCTHFPLVRESIERLYPQLTTIINPAATQARKVKEYLEANNALNTNGEGWFRVYTTGECETYRTVGARLGLRLADFIEQVPAPTLG